MYYKSCQSHSNTSRKPQRVLDTQRDPLRGKLLLHGKRCVRSNMTTERARPPEGAGSNHAGHQA